MLKINKVRYSSRGGLTVELAPPGAVTLTPEEALLVLIVLRASLTQRDLDEAFNEEEQMVLHRYQALCHDHMMALGRAFLDSGKAQDVASQLKTQLAWSRTCATLEAQEVLEQFLGWRVPGDADSGRVNILEQVIRQRLEDPEHYPKAYFAHLLGQTAWGKVSPETMRQLEKHYGPFSLDSI